MELITFCCKLLLFQLISYAFNFRHTRLVIFFTNFKLILALFCKHNLKKKHFMAVFKQDVFGYYYYYKRNGFFSRFDDWWWKYSKNDSAISLQQAGDTTRHTYWSVYLVHISITHYQGLYFVQSAWRVLLPISTLCGLAPSVIWY